jgi:hypothetical protein
MFAPTKLPKRRVLEKAVREIIARRPAAATTLAVKLRLLLARTVEGNVREKFPAPP